MIKWFCFLTDKSQSIMINKNLAQYIKNPRILTILVLGFSSGLPLALTGSTLQAWFTSAGVDLVTIGALTLLGVPYLCKFLWAPILDKVIPPVLGRRRGWVLLTQLGLCAAIFLMAHLNPKDSPSLIGMIALAIAFISASQDIATDAYRTDVLLPEERGLGAAAVTLGFRVAMLASGGLALVLADKIGWQLTYELMALLTGLCIIATLFGPSEPKWVEPPKTLISSIVDPFKDLYKKDRIFLILLFILVYKLGDAIALALMSNFLLGVLHFSLTDVGVAFKTFGLVATLAGAFIGGVLLVRVSLFQALLWFGALQAFSNGMFILLALAGHNYILMVSSIFIESFCSGMSTAAFVAFLMSLCNAKYSATQYACLSAVMAFGRVLGGPIAAYVVNHIGWVNLYWLAFLLSFPGLILLTFLRDNVRTSDAEAIA